MEESIEQLKEMRVIEHMQTISEYVDQVPILRIPAATHRAITATMMREYNEKYFPEELEKEAAEAASKKKKSE